MMAKRTNKNRHTLTDPAILKVVYPSGKGGDSIETHILNLSNTIVEMAQAFEKKDERIPKEQVFETIMGMYDTFKKDDRLSSYCIQATSILKGIAKNPERYMDQA